ncbi:MAG: GspE/PulE family protein [bacterium]|nr:GspE/PulE family protein [bacterium]
MDKKEITEVFEISEKAKKGFDKNLKNVSAIKKVLEGQDDTNITGFLEILFLATMAVDASDIHIESLEGKAKIRLRIDGVLQDVIFINSQLYQKTLSRIKLLSGLKLNIENRAQDGRFSIFFSAKEKIEIRTSTLPSEEGESIVMRILNPKNIIEIEGLGLREDLFNIFNEQIKKPFGMVVVTGPTGSGKTTTLYAFLKRIQNPDIKIITIEDPIEYHLDGISQTQVEPEKGYTFDSGLKAIMRQDPDVILVGEIRDLETSNTAVQASLTGHLVLTTLHTNDAAGAVARFVDLGVRPVSLSPALRMIVAQRLVRKVCGKCGKERQLTKEEISFFKKELAGLKVKNIPKIDAKTKISEAKGCEECNSTGYKGRVGVFEVLLMDDDLEKLIFEKASGLEIKKAAVKKGMVSLYQDGLIKVLENKTTLDEVERVASQR